MHMHRLVGQRLFEARIPPERIRDIRSWNGRTEDAGKLQERVYLDVLQKEVEKEKAEAEEQIRKQKKKAEAAPSEEESGLNRRVITKEINRLLSSESSEDGWMSLAEVGNKLGQKFPDFDVRNFGFSKLSQFVKSTGKYEIKGEVSEANPLSKVYYIRRKQQ